VKILIIRFSSIGDIVLTTPVIRCLKQQLPGCEIHFLTKTIYRELVEHNPWIDQRHYLDAGLSELIPSLKKEKFDLLVDLHHNLRSWRVKMALRRRSVSFNKLNFEKLVYVLTKRNLLPLAHLVDRYLATVKTLGIVNDGAGLDYFIPPGEQLKVEELPLTHVHGYVALAIGGQHGTKKLPALKLKKVIQELHLPVILLGGKEDQADGELLAKENPVKVFNGCGRFSINQSASLIQMAKAVITHDTGMMHIAAAFKKKIISVWGNTVPAFGMAPYFGSSPARPGETFSLSQMIEVKNLWCRPCSKLGYRKCPLGHFNCMNRHSEKEIAAKVL
jgi:heptosyltransferase-2